MGSLGNKGIGIVPSRKTSGILRRKHPDFADVEKI
jgi:hypothetical protein